MLPPPSNANLDRVTSLLGNVSADLSTVIWAVDGAHVAPATLQQPELQRAAVTLLGNNLSRVGPYDRNVSVYAAPSASNLQRFIELFQLSRFQVADAVTLGAAIRLTVGGTIDLQLVQERLGTFYVAPDSLRLTAAARTGALGLINGSASFASPTTAYGVGATDSSIGKRVLKLITPFFEPPELRSLVVELINLAARKGSWGTVAELASAPSTTPISLKELDWGFSHAFTARLAKTAGSYPVESELRDCLSLARRLEVPPEDVQRAVLNGVIRNVMSSVTGPTASVLELWRGVLSDPPCSPQLMAEALGSTLFDVLTRTPPGSQTRGQLERLMADDLPVQLPRKEIDRAVFDAIRYHIEQEDAQAVTHLLPEDQGTTKSPVADFLEHKIQELLETGEAHAALELSGLPIFQASQKVCDLASACLHKVAHNGLGLGGIGEFVKRFQIPASVIRQETTLLSLRNALVADLLAAARQSPAPIIETATATVNELQITSPLVAQAVARAITILARNGDLKAAGNLVTACEAKDDSHLRRAFRVGLIAAVQRRSFAAIKELIDHPRLPKDALQSPRLHRIVQRSTPQILADLPFPEATTLLGRLLASPADVAQQVERAAFQELRSARSLKEIDVITEIMDSWNLLETPAQESRYWPHAAAAAVRLEGDEIHKFLTPSSKQPYRLTPAELAAGATERASQLLCSGATKAARSLLQPFELGFDAPQIEERSRRLGAECLLARGLASEAATLSVPVDPGLRAAARIGVAAAVRASRWKEIPRLLAIAEPSSDAQKSLLEQAIEDGWVTGSTAITRPPFLTEASLQHIAVRAVLRSLAKIDTDRASSIRKAVPPSETTVRDPQLRDLAIQRISTLCELGWKPQHLEFITTLLDLQPPELRDPRILAAAQRGISRELAAGATRTTAAQNFQLWVEHLGAETSATSSTISQTPRAEVTDAQRLAALRLSYLNDGWGERSLEASVDKQACQAVRESAFIELLQRRQFRRARSLSYAIPRVDRELVSTLIPEPSAHLRHFIDRWGCRTIHDLLSRGERYFERRTQTYTAWQGTTYSHGTTTASSPQTFMQRGHGYDHHSRALLQELTKQPDLTLFQGPLVPLPQETSFTCGVAVTRMGLKAIAECQASEIDLRAWLGTTFELGTPLRFFDNLRQKLPDFDIVVGSEGTLDTLRAHLRAGAAVFLNFQLPTGSGAHYALVKGVCEKGILLLDPMYGWSALAADQFTWEGGYDEGRLAGGYVAIYPPTEAVLSNRRPTIVVPPSYAVPYTPLGGTPTTGSAAAPYSSSPTTPYPGPWSYGGEGV